MGERLNAVALFPNSSSSSNSTPPLLLSHSSSAQPITQSQLAKWVGCQRDCCCFSRLLLLWLCLLCSCSPRYARFVLQLDIIRYIDIFGDTEIYYSVIYHNYFNFKNHNRLHVPFVLNFVLCNTATIVRAINSAIDNLISLTYDSVCGHTSFSNKT